MAQSLPVVFGIWVQTGGRGFVPSLSSNAAVLL